MSAKLSLLLAEYQESHMHPINQGIHKLCVPLIVWSTLGLAHLAALSYPWFTLGTVMAIASLLYYLYLQKKLAVMMAAFLAGSFLSFAWLTANFSIAARGWLYAAVFITAWIGQFVGHKIEGRKPSFFQDLRFLLIGPAWVIYGHRQPKP